MKTFTKIFALAVFIACPMATNTSAAIVSYAFSGTISFVNNPSNALPAGIAYSAPFTGSFTYDTTANVYGMDFDDSTNSGDFYFGTNGGFSMSFTVGGHTFADVKHASTVNYAAFIVQNDYFGEDSLSMSDGFPHIFMDGGAFPGNPDTGELFLDFQDFSATALDSDTMPLSAPRLSSFPNAHRMEVDATKNNNVLWAFQGTITNVVQILPPALNIELQPNKTVLLSWPLAAQGYNLEQNTNLIAGIGWQTNAAPIIDTATEHTVALPVLDSMFFRLKTP